MSARSSAARRFLCASTDDRSWLAMETRRGMRGLYRRSANFTPATGLPPYLSVVALAPFQVPIEFEASRIRKKTRVSAGALRCNGVETEWLQFHPCSEESAMSRLSSAACESL